MSDSEEENFNFYGKPLDPYDEDAFPKKRPITVEEQIATDSKGRRRFHGAFTGGFSAGFFNTVGSLEGWLPGEFKSSRGDKYKHVAQNPEDFMDDEDMGEFGFAPQSIRATKEYDTSNKRKRKVFSEGPIPGEPVLHSLLTAGNETVGHLLLKNIGMKEKIKTRDEECSSSNRVYGCEIPKTCSLPETLETRDYDLPEFYKQFLSNPKNDTFGLSYEGLDKTHINLFKSSDLVVCDKNKKLSIRGQAFGVGAFENDDDDIYAKEDMSNYDFELTKEKEKLKNLSKQSEKIFDSFVKAKVNTIRREIYPPPIIPKSFTGKHKVKKSRFEPLEEPKIENNDRRKINATQRAQILDEETNENVTVSKPIPLSTNIKKENPSREVNDNLKVSSSHATKPKTFDPSILLDDRFVTGAQDDEPTNALAPVKKYESDHYSKEMKDAAKMKMFGPLTRISEDWQPCSLLCKRFNVPEPFSDKPAKPNRVKMNNLIFEYQKHHEENVTLKSGLNEMTSENTTTGNDSISENNVEIDSSENNVETKIEDTVIKQEVLETEDDIEKDKAGTKQEDKVIDITDRLNIEEKEDLFKAVFLSSSESEDEPEEETIESLNEKDEISNTREIELKSNILGEEVQLPKIKPLKEGILSGLNFRSSHIFTKPVVEKKDNENITIMDSTDNSNTNPSLYGPKLPDNLKVNNLNTDSGIKMTSSRYTDSSSDEWVEKDNIEKAKKKKQKKSKSSHKKKHKHKKKKRD